MPQKEPEFEMSFENGKLREKEARLPAIIWKRGLTVNLPAVPWQIKPGTQPPPIKKK
jgi:hypothetical protein